MLLSMTGYGESRHQKDGASVAVEIRTINSRYFKLNIRSGDGLAGIESPIEQLVRAHIKRGTIQINLRLDRRRNPDDYQLNADVLASYRQQLDRICTSWELPDAVSLERLLDLPGVVDENLAGEVESDDWPLIESALHAALENLDNMRKSEGQAMATDLHENVQLIAAQLDAIQQRAPVVAENYRARLKDRIEKHLEQFQVSLDPADLIREVSIFAERSDISEEIVRLRSHLEQFETIMQASESSGRKLDFLTQEMFRETNTIGSKANDVEIPRHVIEIKAAIERIREMVQNVE